MKTFLALSLLLTATAARAEIFSCQFTEPFATITYTTGTQTLKVVTPEKTTVTKNVGFLITGTNTYALLSGGKSIMTITLTGKGSDGMSDAVFPYEAAYAPMITNANSGIGGCSSLALKSKPGQP